MLDSEKDYLLVKLEPSEYFRVPLLHDSQLLRAKVMCLLVELAAHDVQNLLVDLHKLDLVVVNFAHLLDLARLRLTVGTGRQTCQKYSFVRAHESLSHLFSLKVGLGHLVEVAQALMHDRGGLTEGSLELELDLPCVPLNRSLRTGKDVVDDYVCLQI